MITKTQNIKNTDGEIIKTITHIYSEHGHFEEDGKQAGCHVSFGPEVDIANYTEVIDEGVTNEFSYDVSDIVLTQLEIDIMNGTYVPPELPPREEDGEDNER